MPGPRPGTGQGCKHRPGRAVGVKTNTQIQMPSSEEAARRPLVCPSPPRQPPSEGLGVATTEQCSSLRGGHVAWGHQRWEPHIWGGPWVSCPPGPFLTPGYQYLSPEACTWQTAPTAESSLNPSSRGAPSLQLPALGDAARLPNKKEPRIYGRSSLIQRRRLRAPQISHHLEKRFFAWFLWSR